MTTSTSLSGRSLAPRPPLKGSFPLDHLGECKPLAQLYAACLQEHSGTASKCRKLAREYLECRMSNGLMAEEELSRLGISPESDISLLKNTEDINRDNDKHRVEEKKGFVAGMRTAKRRKYGGNSTSESTTDDN